MLGCYTVVTSLSCYLQVNLYIFREGYRYSQAGTLKERNQSYLWWLGLMTTKLFSWSQPLQDLIPHQAPWSLLSAVLECCTKICSFQLFPCCWTASEFPFFAEDSPPLRSPIAKILNTSGARQSQIIPAGFAASQEKNRWSVLDVLAWFHLTQIIHPSQDVYFVFRQQCICPGLETLGGVKIGCAEMWALSFVLPKG